MNALHSGTTCVLIIDSDNVRRGMLACTLPVTRYRLEFASSPEMGLDLLIENNPQIVIVGSNSASSSDLCQRIRSLPAGNQCLLILMDERFRDKEQGRQETEAAGADTFLPFPFGGDLFESRLKTYQLARKRCSSLREMAVQVKEESSRESAIEAHVAKQEEAEDTWLLFKEKVDSIHRSLNSVDYYKLLEVPQDATLSEIKDAYFTCAMEYHPDRFLQHDDEELKTKIYELFKRMSEAFKVLINPEVRSRYDSNLAGPNRNANLRFLERDRSSFLPKDPTVDATTPAGKKYLHHAILAQSEGRLRSARMYLSMALQYEPDNEALQMRLDEMTRRL